ncbi:SDR family NAD(P)-dependent oxidoreductase [Patescibacteria group bacterium]
MLPKYNIKGKVVIITGAAHGIGKEITKRFLMENAIVVMIDKNKQAFEEFVNRSEFPNDQLDKFIGDIADEEFVKKVVVEVFKRYKKIDVLINNVGIYEPTYSILKMKTSTWKKTLDINLTGTFFFCREVSKLMVKNKIKGSIINMSSTNGLVGEKDYIAYNASKGGVTLLTKGMALDLAEYGIRVNAVCPGYIATPRTIKMDGGIFMKKYIKENIPIGRAGKESDVAGVFLFLSSEDAKFITGACIVVDGGQLAG